MRARSPVTRAQFLRIAAGGLLGSVVIVSAACGGDDDGVPIDAAPPDVDAPPATDAATDGQAIDAPPGACAPEATIGNNHGHVLAVSAADVAAAQERTYDIAGGAGHAHSVTLTAAHFQMLAANQSITVTSTTGSAHSHSVTVRCAA